MLDFDPHAAVDAASALAAKKGSNVAITNDGEVHTTTRRRPDAAPFKAGIVTTLGGTLRLVTFSDRLREAWNEEG